MILMILKCEGDIFDSDCEALVNPVNCVGVSGAGLAKQFREHFPEEQKIYWYYCMRHEIKPGHPWIVTIHRDIAFAGEPPNPKYIVYFPTKGHYKDKSHLRDIHNGLVSLAIRVEEMKIESIAIPDLGWSLGGLPWNEIPWNKVSDQIHYAFEFLEDVRVLVYGPGKEERR